MSLRTITGTLYQPTGEPIEGARIVFELQGPGFAVEGQYSPRMSVATTDEDGAFSIELWPNTLGAVATAYLCRLPTGDAFAFILPEGSPLTLSECRALGEVDENWNEALVSAFALLKAENLDDLADKPTALANLGAAPAALSADAQKSAIRAQVEAELVAGSGVTITPGSSGATRTLTLSAAGGAGTGDVVGPLKITGPGPSDGELWSYDGAQTEFLKTYVSDGVIFNEYADPTDYGSFSIQIPLVGSSALLDFSGLSAGAKTYTFPATSCAIAANPMTTAGDLVYGGASGVPTRLAAGTNGHVLTLAAGVPSWSASAVTPGLASDGEVTTLSADGKVGVTVDAIGVFTRLHAPDTGYTAWIEVGSAYVSIVGLTSLSVAGSAVVTMASVGAMGVDLMASTSQAEALEYLGITGGGPAGGIVFTGELHDETEGHYLLADGRVVTQAAYPALFAATGHTVGAWSTAAIGGGFIAYGVVWAPSLGKFCAIGLVGGVTSGVRTSTDGVTWTTPVDWGIHTSYVNYAALCWASGIGAGLFVAMPYAYGPGVFTSADGITWASGGDGTQELFRAVVWAQSLGLLIAVGDSVAASSPNATAWTTRSIPAGDWRRVAWSEELGIAVAIRQGGVATSTNGTSWTAGTIAAYQWRDVCWAAEIGVFVAVAHAQSFIARSRDGLTWETIALPAGTDCSTITWAAEFGVFVGTGLTSQGTGLISPDGITWRNDTSIPLALMAPVAYAPALKKFLVYNYYDATLGGTAYTAATSFALPRVSTGYAGGRGLRAYVATGV